MPDDTADHSAAHDTDGPPRGGMAYKSRVAVGSMAVWAVAAVVYGVLAALKGSPASLGSWALLMLGFIAVVVLALIGVRVALNVALAVRIAAAEGPEAVAGGVASDTAEDEMDRLIDLTASRAAYVLSGLGFVAALLALALGAPAVVALHVILGASVLGALVENAVALRGYERGIRHA